MTVAAAIGQQEPDDWTIHFEDTLRAGRGLCDEELSRFFVRKALNVFRNGAVGHTLGAGERPH